MSMAVNDVFKAYGAIKPERMNTGRSSRADDKNDSAEISSKAKDFGTIFNALAASPDLRPDKVEGIKTQYDMGRYSVSSSAIASKILGDQGKQ